MHCVALDDADVAIDICELWGPSTRCAHADMVLNDLQYEDTAQKMLLVDLLRLLLSHVHSHVVLSSCMHSTRKEKVANTFMLEILAALLEASIHFIKFNLMHRVA